MKKQRILIYANGALSPEDLTHITGREYVIGVDRAAYWLMTNGKPPTVAVGDFDSVTKGELAVIKNNVRRVYTYPAAKDSTDTAIAVEHALGLSPKDIILLGCFGGRIDHMVAVLQLLQQCFARGVPAYICDAYNQVSLLNSRRTIYKREGFHYVSVLAHSPEIAYSAEGFLYPAVKKRIVQGQTVGVSNELVGSRGIITVHTGIAMVILSRDKDGGSGRYLI